jgi:hypothetical protein
MEKQTNWAGYEQIGQIFAGQLVNIHGAMKKGKKKKKNRLAGGAAVSERKNGDGGSPRGSHG